MRPAPGRTAPAPRRRSTDRRRMAVGDDTLTGSTRTGSTGTGSRLADARIGVRTQLVVLWICHFILWIFGDMFSLLQEMTEPATDAWVEVVAPSTAIVLT